MSTPNRAGILLPVSTDNNEEVLMLVMPVMLNSYA
jgi:DNA polymerase-3 subunit beta